MKLRAANLEDKLFLWVARYHAALLDPQDDAMAVVQSHPVLARYVEGWRQVGYRGVIAEHENKPAGKAWCRLFPKETPG